MTPPAICKLVKAGQKAKRLTSYICGKAITTRADVGFGPIKIERNQLSWVNETLRAYHKNKRASEVRHVVFALPKGIPRKEATETLLKIALDWVGEYAPGRHWCFGVHDDNGFYHAHLAVANTGEQGKALEIDQYDVKNMAAMKFTTAAVSAKGTGMNTGLPVYSKAAKLDVRDLAESLVDAKGNFDDNRWQEMLHGGKLSDIHLHARTGDPTSFLYEGRFIGIKNLWKFIDHEQTKKQLALAEAPAPVVAPPPPSTPVTPPVAVIPPVNSLADLISRFAKAAQLPAQPSVQPQPPNIH
jgi:hypothetical protein